jgi:predicted permease
VNFSPLSSVFSLVLHRAFWEDTLRDIRYALRTFRRAPLIAFTIVSTVALGLGLVAVAFTMLNALLFRVDAVPDVHEMFAVERSRTTEGANPGFTRAQFDALRRETNVFTDAYAILGDVDSRVDGQLMFGTFVTGNFFQVVRVNAAMGRTLTPADDEPNGGQPVIVLSHRGWDRLFARDPAILSRRLLINGVTFEIVGVMPESFRGLTFAPDDYWAPLSMIGHVRPTLRGREATIGLGIIGRLKPGLSWQTAQAGLAVWDTGQTNDRPLDSAPGGSLERRTSNITLVPRRGTIPQPLEAIAVVAPAFFAFGLILLIGCANVANLLLARAVARQREIGIRLSLGASRRRIIRQLLTESLLLALVAAAAGFAISRVVLDAVISAVMSSGLGDFGDIRLSVPAADWRVLVFLVIGAAISTIVFGLAPALQATRIELIRTMRGEVSRDARPGLARNFLMGMQVTASALLLISAAVFLRSAFAAATFDSGMRTSDTIAISIANELTRTAIVQALTTEPSIAAVAASGPEVSGLASRAFGEASGAKVAVAQKFVSPETFSVLNVPVMRGRAFTPAERTPNLSVAIVSESAARELWPGGDALGQALRFDPDVTSAKEERPLESRTFTVVGIVRDVPGFRFAPFKRAVVYVPTNAEMQNTMLVARVHGDPDRARETILNRVTTIDPDMARQVTTMRNVARAESYFLQLAFSLTIVLGGLALALTLSGLFSVLSYLVEQRKREIGVRMALGATTRDVTRLVLSQSMWPVGLGLLVGGSLAAGLAALLLSTPSAATIGAIVRVFDPIAYAASFLIIVAACLMASSIPAARAARLDPSRALRPE